MTQIRFGDFQTLFAKQDTQNLWSNKKLSFKLTKIPYFLGHLEVEKSFVYDLSVLMCFLKVNLELEKKVFVFTFFSKSSN